MRCPGHGHRPHPVSFLWHDYSHMPAHNQRATHHQPGTQGDRGSSTLSYLCHRQSFISASVTLVSAHLVCFCISLFMHPVSPGLGSMNCNNRMSKPEYHPARCMNAEIPTIMPYCFVREVNLKTIEHLHSLPMPSHFLW